MILAAIQLDTAPTDITSNVRKAMDWTRRAFDAGAGMVFLHEGLTADYSPDPIHYGRAVDGPEVYGFVDRQAILAARGVHHQAGDNGDAQDHGQDERND